MSEEKKGPIEPSEGSENSAEDPKEIAKGMLIDGVDIDEVANATGLTRNVVWGLKGLLARTGKIPTKAELAKMPKPGPAEQEFREAGEGVPFRRPRPAHVLIESILNQFGVKERARELIVSRAKRAGGMHPSELERALMDLDTGLVKREVSYITEEYYLATQQEEDVSRDLESRSYPVRRGEQGRSSSYPTRYGERDQPSTDYSRDRDSGRRPWDRSREGYGEERPLTTRDIMDIMEKRERDFEDRMRRSTLEDKMSSIGEDISVLATELKNIKDNPPMQSQPQGEGDFVKALQHTIDRQDRRQDELMDIVRTERGEAKDDAKDLREIYEERLEKQEKKFRDELDKKGVPRDTTGYRDDSVRLAAEGLHEMADVMRSRGSPFKIMIEGLPVLMGDEGRPPQRERGRPASVADLVGPDYVEE